MFGIDAGIIVESAGFYWNPYNFQYVIVWIFIKSITFSKNMLDLYGIAMIFIESVEFELNRIDLHIITRICYCIGMIFN